MYFKRPITIYDPTTFEAITKYKEVCLEEYVWSIHELVDKTLNRILLPQRYFHIPKKPKLKPIYNNFGNGKVLVGFKGQQYMTPGYVYAPYIPLQMAPKYNTSKRIYKKG